MTLERLLKHTKETQNEIKAKLRILEAMSPAHAGYWLLNTPEDVLFSYDAKGIYEWHSRQKS